MNEDTVAGQGEQMKVANTSSIGPMLWIGFYTVLLNLVTLTIFRFWGRTHFRRRLWSDTSVGGEPLAYTGRGVELFIGFFIAIFTLMIPFVGAVLAAQILFGPAGAAFVIVPLYLALFVLIGVAIFLARRYHLSRTQLRGIRFAQTGSAWGYGFATFGYGILSGITLGWFGPAARIRLSRKMWSKAYFGNLPFQFEDTPEALAEPVYKSFAVAWVGSVVAYFVWIGIIASSGVAEGLGDSPAIDPKMIAFFYLSAIPLGLLIGIFISWHEAVMIRRIVKSLRVGDLRATSRIGMWDILELSITNTLLIIFTLGFGYMAAQMRLWKRLANRMALDGAIDFDAIRQSEIEAPRQGEGLADGLDIISNF
ncbi:MAG: DUF898 domain-containing protein [Alphaproteobacteria bacterium]|nr:DUF898 domain-containing protein [Alphaproteobacteria bacterium]